MGSSASSERSVGHPDVPTHRFFHLAADMLAVASFDGSFLAVNESWTTTLGWTEADLLGRPFLDFVHPDDVENTLAESAAMDERGSANFTNRYRCKDGSHRWLEWVSEPRPEEGYIYAIARDVTDRRESKHELELANRRFRSIIEHSPIGLALVALDGRFMSANAALCDIVGYTEAELQDLTFQDITHPDDLHIDLAHVQSLIDGEISAYRMEKRYFDARGRIVWIQLSGSIVRAPDGSPLHFIAQIEDISERKRREQDLTRQAERDQVTGVLNRAVFDRDLTAFERAARRYGEIATLLVLDLDDFKDVNDAGGHAAGDALLREVVQAMRTRVRVTDQCYRIGGDEFAVILPHATAAGAQALRRSLERAIAGVEVVADGQRFTVTASIGCAAIDGLGAAAALEQADAEMYERKRQAKGRPVLRGC